MQVGGIRRPCAPCPSSPVRYRPAALSAGRSTDGQSAPLCHARTRAAAHLRTPALGGRHRELRGLPQVGNRIFRLGASIEWRVRSIQHSEDLQTVECRHQPVSILGARAPDLERQIRDPLVGYYEMAMTEAAAVAALIRDARYQPLFVAAAAALAGSYLAASTAAALLKPRFGWRIRWLFGPPTGLALIALNTRIPDSPSFLLLRAGLASSTAS